MDLDFAPGVFEQLTSMAVGRVTGRWKRLG